MFDKLDAYNLFANLVPGAALTYALHFAGYPTPTTEQIGAFLLVAFVAGVATNRLGSLVLDPILRSLRFLKVKDYSSFLSRERSDRKLDAIVANAGLYRTLCTAGLLYLGASALWPLTRAVSPHTALFVFVLFGIIIFLFALQKEDGYIHSRLKQPSGDTISDDLSR